MIKRETLGKAVECSPVAPPSMNFVFSNCRCGYGAPQVFHFASTQFDWWFHSTHPVRCVLWRWLAVSVNWSRIWGFLRSRWEDWFADPCLQSFWSTRWKLAGKMSDLCHHGRSPLLSLDFEPTGNAVTERSCLKWLCCFPLLSPVWRQVQVTAAQSSDFRCGVGSRHRYLDGICFRQGFWTLSQISERLACQ